MQNLQTNKTVHQQPLARHRSPHRTVINVTPRITTSNANTQKGESLLALLVGIAIGIAGTLAAIERAKRQR